MAARILAFAGSMRKDSYNKKLVKVAAGFARDAGAEVTVVDLRDYPLPVFDEDLEAAEGAPANATRLYELFTSHQGLLISAPEYNSSITAVLKNTIDWLSRPRDGEPPLGAFKGKTAGLLAASPGALGGLRGLVHMAAILGNISVLVIPGQVAVASAHKVIAADGTLTDENMRSRVKQVAEDLVAVTSRVSG